MLAHLKTALFSRDGIPYISSALGLFKTSTISLITVSAFINDMFDVFNNYSGAQHKEKYLKQGTAKIGCFYMGHKVETGLIN